MSLAGFAAVAGTTSAFLQTCSYLVPGRTAAPRFALQAAGSRAAHMTVSIATMAGEPMA